jgi:head-tail adaptor
MLPKRLATGTRYLPSSAFNCYVSFIQVNTGQAADGELNAPVTVVSGIHANLAPWRGKEVDKPQTRIGQSSYKITIRYPQTYTIDTGMQVQLVRGNTAHLFDIETMLDPDGQGVELVLWVWENNVVAGA